MRLGYRYRGCREETALFEVREEEVQFESVAVNKASGALGIAEIGIRSRARWAPGLPPHGWGNGGEGALALESGGRGQDARTARLVGEYGEGTFWDNSELTETSS